MDDKYAIMCVQHDYAPTVTVKLAGKGQEPYPRKNWSSLVRPTSPRIRPPTATAAPASRLDAVSRWLVRAALSQTQRQPAAPAKKAQKCSSLPCPASNPVRGYSCCVTPQVLYNCGHPANQCLTLDMINSQTGTYLHRFSWLTDDALIGKIDYEWNFLARICVGGAPIIPRICRGIAGIRISMNPARWRSSG